MQSFKKTCLGLIKVDENKTFFNELLTRTPVVLSHLETRDKKTEQEVAELKTLRLSSRGKDG